jgi:hypothetical protein
MRVFDADRSGFLEAEEVPDCSGISGGGGGVNIQARGLALTASIP